MFQYNFLLNTKICRWINFSDSFDLGNLVWKDFLNLVFVFQRLKFVTHITSIQIHDFNLVSLPQKYSITSYSIQLFVSACQKLTTSKSSRPTTPNHYTPRGQQQPSYNPAGGPYAMASPGNATGSTTTGNGYGPGTGIISGGGAPPSPGFQHSPHHASIPSSYHKVNMREVHSLFKF